MNKITDFINVHFDELTSVKFVVIVMSVSINVMLIVGYHYLIVRDNIAAKYIDVLEEQIGDNLDDTAGSTDAYADYYRY